MSQSFPCPLSQVPPPHSVVCPHLPPSSFCCSLACRSPSRLSPSSLVLWLYKPHSSTVGQCLYIPPWSPSPGFHLLYILFLSEISQELLVHPCRPPHRLCLIFHSSETNHFGGLDEVILEKNQQFLLDPFSLQSLIPWDSFKEIPEEIKVCSLEI